MSRVVLLLLSTVIALTAAEVTVRILDLGPQIHPILRENYRALENPVLGYGLSPGSRDGDFRINQHGMRDREHAVPKPAGVFRIACLGDSISYGFGLRQDQSYPWVLQDYLNQRTQQSDESYEVLNLGVAGYNVTQSIENLKAHGLRYQPDLVLFQYCLNDPLEYKADLDEFRSPRVGRAARLLRFSRFFAFVTYSVHSRMTTDSAQPGFKPAQVTPGIPPYADYFMQLHADPISWRRVETGLDELAALAREHGFRAAVVVFPLFQDLEAYHLRAVHDQVLQAAQLRSLEGIDLLDVYASAAKNAKQLVHGAGLHPNVRGSRLAASTVADELLRRGLLPKPH